MEQIPEKANLVESEKHFVGACQQAALCQHGKHGGGARSALFMGQPASGQVVDEAPKDVLQPSGGDGGVHVALEMGGSIADPEGEAVPSEKFFRCTNAGELAVVFLHRDLPEPGFEVQLGPVAVLANFDEDVLDVGDGKGITAGLGVEGAVINDEAQFIRAGFGDGEAGGSPGGGGALDEAVLVEGGDFFAHEFRVGWGGADGGTGGGGAKGMDLEGCDVSRGVEVGKVQGERVDVVMDGLIVVGTVVGGKFGIDDGRIELNDAGQALKGGEAYGGGLVRG